MRPLERLAGAVAFTPLHPQWLLGRRSMPKGIDQARGTLLDIGSADRWIEARLPEQIHYVALDYPDTGRDLYGSRPHVFADAARLPFADACIDAIVCLEVVEHVRDPKRVFREIARVLRPGGRAWLSMPFLYPVHDAPHDYQRYTVHGLRRDAEGAGLQVVALSPTGHAVRTAGLIACLALAGPLQALHGISGWIFAVLASPAILAINLGAWTLSAFWPDWDALSSGHVMEVRRP